MAGAGHSRPYVLLSGNGKTGVRCAAYSLPCRPDGTEPIAFPADGTEPIVFPADGMEPIAFPADSTEPIAFPEDSTNTPG